mmetsp:Transcript_48488/g.128272  ORF Transcript_48488/g.128272 Transcript_48488/m.128272 type:complete len:96 (+) Transcript_48488:72-359(+)
MSSTKFHNMYNMCFGPHAGGDYIVVSCRKQFTNAANQSEMGRWPPVDPLMSRCCNQILSLKYSKSKAGRARIHLGMEYCLTFQDHPNFGVNFGLN